jgi:hypothetical protein
VRRCRRCFFDPLLELYKKVSAFHAALLAYIGLDPYQGQWGSSSFWPQHTGYVNVGSDRTFVADKSGTLWLGINDDAVTQSIQDNYGSMSAEVTINLGTPQNFTVTANPLWTNTGISVNAGDIIHVNASGTWTYMAGVSTGPNGIYDAEDAYDEFYN